MPRSGTSAPTVKYASPQLIVLISFALDLQTRLYELFEQRLGMLPLDKYTSRHPLVDPAIFDTESSRIATHVSQRIPGDSSITVFVKNFGGKIGVECIENVMKRELGKIPKNVEV